MRKVAISFVIIILLCGPGTLTIWLHYILYSVGEKNIQFALFLSIAWCTVQSCFA